ncbi:Glycine betaine/carnitine/choline transport system permease protein OpuCB [Corynebacterium ciconiae DSM 44920]|uniref:ABC transporter permease n=1 Tax=Corynebacterium ciconiae TaxID=227319 RepID=UPI00037C763D|nr:ABC transporter permease [Corynebacterium ciconiae]WKD62133.1 Glycine betaine/carnitine/choline transport system permease protein OpuCB [Corynebacterium ciconiae DSM 44920]
MGPVVEAFQQITSASQWSGSTGFGVRILEHLQLTLLTMAGALLIGLPVGIWLGVRAHRTGKSGTSIVSALGALRALPTLGLVTWLTLIIPFGISMPTVPAVIVLVILAVPPVVAGAYSGIAAIEHSVVDAAVAMGHSPWQALRAVHVPLALPTIIGGIRSATVQVLATATVAAYIGLGGLGRPLIDGLALRDYPQMLAGAFLVIALAWFVDMLLAVAQRATRPRM